MAGVDRFGPVLQSEGEGRVLQTLLRAGEVLGPVLPPDRVLRELAHLLVEDLADMAATYRIEEDGSFRRMARCHRDPAGLHLLDALEGQGRGHGPKDLHATLLRGEILVVRGIDDELLGEHADGPEQADSIRALELDSVVVAPLRVRGRTVAAFVAATTVEGEPPFHDRELGGIRQLADRAATALDNAGLFQGVTRKSWRLEEAARQLEAMVAELERDREEHRALQDRVRFALEAGRMGTWEWDLASDTVYWSEALGRIHGLDPAKLPHTLQQVLQRVHEADRKKLVRAIRRGREDPTPEVECEYRVVLHGGEERWLMGRGRVVVGPEGKPRRMLGACLDVTELARARERAERGVRVRDEMLAFVSHDLRQPIGLVQTAARALVELPLTEDQRQSFLERVLRASEHADRLIDDLLDSARSDLGRLEVRAQPVEPAALVQHVAEAFRGEAEHAGLDLAVDVAPEVPPVRADRPRILRVLWNLTANAIRCTPKGGAVTLKAREAEGGARVEFLVSDTGEGIAESDRSRIFERYWQGDSKSGKGMGLGLSIAREIVEAHDGHIWVESRQGTGSTFGFDLPTSSQGVTGREEVRS